MKPLSPEGEDQRHDRAIGRFLKGFGVAMAGTVVLLTGFLSTPAMQEGPGRGDTPVVERPISHDASWEDALMIGGGVLITAGAAVMAVGAIQEGSLNMQEQQRNQTPQAAA